MICMRSGVSLYTFRAGKLNKKEALDIKESLQAFAASKNIFIEDALEVTGSYLEKTIRKYAKSNRKQLIVIDDFSQLLKKDCFFDGCEEEFPDVEYVSKRIKRLAKETGAVFILGVNLIRDEVELVVRIPALEQLGENRGILNLAHKVFLLYRNAYYNREFKSDKFQIQIAKNIAGKTGYCNLSFNEKTGLIEEPKNV